MPEDILKNTLTGTLNAPELGKIPQALVAPDVDINASNLAGGIQKLQVAQHAPSALIDFQRVMGSVSRFGYSQRQKSELSDIGFEPSEVSGNTFASIISDFESKRGADIGKLYVTTMSAYATAQEQITNRLQFMQQLQESRKQFEDELKLKKERLRFDKSLSKKEFKLKKKQLDQDQANWEREFSLAQYKAQRVIDTINTTPDWAL